MLCWWPVTKNCIVWRKRASMSVQGCYFQLWSTSVSKIHQKVPLSWWSSACKSRGSYSPFLNGILKINNQHSHQTKLWNVLLKVSLEIPSTLLKAEPIFFFFFGILYPESQSSQAAPVAHLRTAWEWAALYLELCFFLGLRGSFVHPLYVSVNQEWNNQSNLYE